MRKILTLLLSFALLAFASFTAGAQTVPRTATLQWGAVTAYDDGTPLANATYQVYQGIGPGATKAKVGAPITATTLTVSTGLLGGTTYCWQVTTVVGTQESAFSNEACKTFPAPKPQAPALTVQ